MFQKTRLSDKNSLGIINDPYLYSMILLTRIVEDLTKPQVKESVDPALLKMIDQLAK
jgi:hypothetical protein